jgi:hypothetical protein
VDSPFKHPFAFTSRNADNICSVNYTHLHAQTVPIPGTFFLNAVYPGNVKTFITHADHDNAINVLAIQRAFLDTTHVSTSPYPNLVSTCTFDSLFPNSSRPGRMIIGYNLNNASRAIRFPEYANAGHSVSQRMPAQLLTDVIQWYNN